MKKRGRILNLNDDGSLAQANLNDNHVQ